MKAHGKILGSEGYIHYLNCGDGLVGVSICQNLTSIHFTYVQFILCQLYLNKATKNNSKSHKSIPKIPCSLKIVY